ncbi:MAG: rhodanese-like domain-containing protein [Oscillospiraceae bacterium]|nr:rhodanese-like domain-containing protein [Oscillospiraceae bacterium]
MAKRMIGLLLAVTMLTACATATTAAAAQTITAQQAYNMMQDGNAFMLIDVRTFAEFQAQHIASAVNISYDEIAFRSTAELPKQHARILLYCQTGRRSAIAAQALAELGYTQVYDFGGIISWPFGTVSSLEPYAA